jgi:hypothetical protein
VDTAGATQLIVTDGSQIDDVFLRRFCLGTLGRSSLFGLCRRGLFGRITLTGLGGLSAFGSHRRLGRCRIGLGSRIGTLDDRVDGLRGCRRGFSGFRCRRLFRPGAGDEAGDEQKRDSELGEGHDAPSEALLRETHTQGLGGLHRLPAGPP